MMMECVLRGRDTERDVVDARKGPRVSDPLRQESDHRWVFAGTSQRRAIAKSYFHLGRWQRPGEFLRDRAISAIGADQELTRQFFASWGSHNPSIFCAFESTRRYLIREYFSACLARSLTQ